MKTNIRVLHPFFLTFLLSGVLILSAEGENLTAPTLREDFPVGLHPGALTFDGANIWVVNSGDDSVTKLRASDGANLGTFPVGDNPLDLVFDGTNIWVSNAFDETVTELRASDGAVIGCFSGPIPLGSLLTAQIFWSQTSNTALLRSCGRAMGTTRALTVLTRIRSIWP